jgi:hypothetical protein
LAGVLWRVSGGGDFDAIARGLRFPGGVAAGEREILVSERDAGRVALVPLPGAGDRAGDRAPP